MTTPMIFTNTTDLDLVRMQPNRFTWGKVEKIHDLGRYTFIEFTSRLQARNVTKGTTLSPSVEFHIYVDGRETNQSASTIEGAMLTAISIAKVENPNTAAHLCFAAAKLLNVNE